MRLKAINDFNTFLEIEEIPIDNYIMFSKYSSLHSTIGSDLSDAGNHDYLLNLFDIVDKKKAETIRKNQQQLAYTVKNNRNFILYAYICLRKDQTKFDLKSISQVCERILKMPSNTKTLIRKHTLELGRSIQDQLVSAGFIDGEFCDEELGWVTEQDKKNHFNLYQAFFQAIEHRDISIMLNAYANMHTVNDARDIEHKVYKNMKGTLSVLRKNGFNIETVYDYYLASEQYKEIIKPLLKDKNNGKTTKSNYTKRH